MSTPEGGSAVSEPSSRSELGATEVQAASELDRFFYTLANPDDARDRGFIAFVGGRPQLGRIQASCLDPSRTKERCLTVRYRAENASGFGTLFAAFHTDLWAIKTEGWLHGGKYLGDFLPAPGVIVEGGPWSTVIESYGFGENPIDAKIVKGKLDSLIDVILQRLDSLEVLPRDSRLLLFFEVLSTNTSEQDWHSEFQHLLLRLPERVGIVVAGAPEMNAITLSEAQSRDPNPPTRTINADQILNIELPGTVDQSSGSEPEVVPKFIDSALSGDQPAERDRLGVAGYADALARLVLLPQTRPLTIGIHAPWGRGKSSFLRFVRQSLVRRTTVNQRNGLSTKLDSIESAVIDNERKLEVDPSVVDKEFNRRQDDLNAERQELLVRMEHAARHDLVLVDFNAWRYENSTQIWAGLAAEILRSFEACLGPSRRLLSRVSYAFWRNGAETALRALIPASIAIAITLVLWLAGSQRLIAQSLPQLPEWAHLVVTAVPAAAVLLTLGLVAERFHRVVQPVSQRVFDYVQRPDYQQQTGLQNRVIQDLAFLRRRIPPSRTIRTTKGTSAYATPLVVVFIDDLDRCSEDKVMELMQAINLVLGASDYFVFLALDTDMIYRAIDKHYGLDHKDSTGNDFAESYLRKIIQLSFHLPEITAEQRLRYVVDLFSPSARREFASQRHYQWAAQPIKTPDLASTPAAQSDPWRFDLGEIRTVKETVLSEVEDTADELRAFAGVEDFIDENPRELKRLVNVHRLTKILIQRTGELATPAWQCKLVVWLVFCAHCRDLVDDALALAESDRSQDDILRELAVRLEPSPTRDWLANYAISAYVVGAQFTAGDLAGRSTFAEAARISHMVRDVRAPTKQEIKTQTPDKEGSRDETNGTEGDQQTVREDLRSVVPDVEVKAGTLPKVTSSDS